MSTEKEESNLVANVLVHRVVTSFRSTAYITKFLILKVLVTEHVEPPKRFKLFCELQLHSPHTHTSQLQQHIKLSAEMKNRIASQICWTSIRNQILDGTTKFLLLKVLTIEHWQDIELAHSVINLKYFSCFEGSTTISY